jgi:hypothetical protein
MDSDKLSVNLKENPEVAAALAGTSPGDYVKLQLEICIDEIAEDMLVGSIHDVDVDSVQITPGPENEDADEETKEKAAPVVSVMAAGYRKK